MADPKNSRALVRNRSDDKDTDREPNVQSLNPIEQDVKPDRIIKLAKIPEQFDHMLVVGHGDFQVKGSLEVRLKGRAAGNGGVPKPAAAWSHSVTLHFITFIRAL